MDKNAINKARSVYYGLFSAFFSFFEDDKKAQEIYNTLTLMSENSINEYEKDAIQTILAILDEKGLKEIKLESDDIFFNPYSEYIAVSASYYDEQRDDGKKRLEMIDYLLHSKFRKDTTVYKENEDHIGFMCLFMQKLIQEALGGDKVSEELSKKVFSKVINPFVDEFIASLYAHQQSYIYKEVAVMLQVFIEIERLLLEQSKPAKSVKPKMVVLEKKERKEPVDRGKRNLDELRSL